MCVRLTTPIVYTAIFHFYCVCLIFWTDLRIGYLHLRTYMCSLYLCILHIVVCIFVPTCARCTYVPIYCWLQMLYAFAYLHVLVVPTSVYSILLSDKNVLAWVDMGRICVKRSELHFLLPHSLLWNCHYALPKKTLVLICTNLWMQNPINWTLELETWTKREQKN